MTFRHRHGTFIILTLVALLGFSAVSLAQVGTWTTKTPMPTARTLLSTSVVDGKIYAIGGVPGGALTTPTSVVEVYDPVTDAWAAKVSMPTPRAALSTGVVNGKIYAIGGYDDPVHPDNVLSTVEEYDPVTDTWTPRENMPTARSRLVALVVNEKIYAIGGSAGRLDDVVSTVEVYNPATDTWTEKAPMPTARTYFSAGAVNGIIYALGGAMRDAARSTFEVYDVATDYNTPQKLDSLLRWKLA